MQPFILFHTVVILLGSMDHTEPQLQNECRTFSSAVRQNNRPAAEPFNDRRRQQFRPILQETLGPIRALYNQSPTTQAVNDLQGRAVLLHHRETSRPRPSTTQDVNCLYGLFDLQETPGYSIQCTSAQHERDVMDDHRSAQPLSSHTTENTEPVICCGLTENCKPFAQCMDI
jgi:hypothetical protein